VQNNQSGPNENHKPLHTGISQTRQTLHCLV